MLKRSVHVSAVMSVALVFCLFAATPTLADSPSVSVRQIGALFIEAPPDGDKNLMPMTAFSSNAQEKVEAYAVVQFTNRIITDTPTFSDSGNVSATATLADKTTIALGSAQTSPFRKLSADSKKTLISMSVNKVSDKEVAVVNFKGVVKISVAAGTKQATTDFQPKVGAPINIGLGKVTLTEFDAQSFTLSGDESLNQIASLKIIKPDGTAMQAERGAYSRQGFSGPALVTSQWRFKAPIGPGKLEVTVYDKPETIDVPVDLKVRRPY